MFEQIKNACESGSITKVPIDTLKIWLQYLQSSDEIGHNTYLDCVKHALYLKG